MSYRLYSLRRKETRELVGLSFDRSRHTPVPPGMRITYCDVSTTRHMVRSIHHYETGIELFSSAYRVAVRDGAITTHRITDTDDPAWLCLKALEDAQTLDGYISTIINNPRSRFYIHG